MDTDEMLEKSDGIYAQPPPWLKPIDRARWGAGPWDDEPDYDAWIYPTSGLDCRAFRGPSGDWYGYVEVPPEHPWIKLRSDRLSTDTDLVRAELDDKIPVDWFGGLREEPNRIWLGFDCHHAFQYVPGWAWQRQESSVEQYVTLAQLRGRLSHLGLQVAAAWPRDE